MTDQGFTTTITVDRTPDISEDSGGTQIRFSHLGLVPADECFDVCSGAWGYFIGGSLRNLITTGQGQPMRKE